MGLRGDNEKLFMRDVKTLISDNLYAPTIDQLNDLHEGLVNDEGIRSIMREFSKLSKSRNDLALNAYDSLRKKLREVGIYSLCTNAENEPLWTHYSTDHTGFVIEYDLDFLEKSLNYNLYMPLINIIKVNYTDNPPTVNFDDLFGNNKESFLRLFLGNKEKKWSYEEEIRFITEPSGTIRIDHRAITGIYFGYKMDDSEIDCIMRGLKGRGLSYYKMVLNKDRFGLTAVKIPDKYNNTELYIPNKIDYELNEIFLDSIYPPAQLTYKDKLIEALEIVRYDPLITDIDIATIDMDQDNQPIFKIFAETIYPLAPRREYKFGLCDDGSLISLN
ncbi:Protein of unknown function [Porphyromonas circumdentaria]|uniref:DUF2971 domain-containing protein n=2 Tax=Porphyromonas circumdentaria TaxID=29524 RepID=A0A1T4PVU4_9PORP|nr:Protein of unknown function [Porphyromonas circumdentaria]